MGVDHIGFKVKKYCKYNEYECFDTTNGKKKVIWDQNVNIIINLGLVEEHYFLNEQVESITKDSLNNFESLIERYPNKTMTEILSLSKKGNRFAPIKCRTHIQSYELINIISSDKV